MASQVALSAKNSAVGVAFNPSVERPPLFSEQECEAVIGWTEARRSSGVGEALVLRHGSQWVPGGAADAAPGPDGCVSAAGEAAAITGRGGIIIPNGSTDRLISWLPRKLKKIVGSLNSQIWKFDITSWSEVAVLRYGIGDGLSLHYDLDDHYCDRKIVVLLQLSPGSAYEGGTLEFGLTPPIAASRTQGSLVAFPAWVPHQVTAMTSGARYVARCFALGPSFR